MVKVRSVGLLEATLQQLDAATVDALLRIPPNDTDTLLSFATALPPAGLSEAVAITKLVENCQKSAQKATRLVITCADRQTASIFVRSTGFRCIVCNRKCSRLCSKCGIVAVCEACEPRLPAEHRRVCCAVAEQASPRTLMEPAVCPLADEEDWGWLDCSSFDEALAHAKEEQESEQCRCRSPATQAGSPPRAGGSRKKRGKRAK